MADDAPLSPASPQSPDSPAAPATVDAGSTTSPPQDVDVVVAMVHEEPVVFQTLKLARTDTARSVIDACKKRVAKTASLDNYCIFWPREDDEDRDSIFLEPDRPLSYYPDLVSGTHLEFRLCRRSQPVYINEQKSNLYTIDETWPVARVTHEIAGKLGLRDASRYGLLLLGKEEEVRQRREELEGQWLGRRPSMALPNSPTTSGLSGMQPSRPIHHSTSSNSISSFATLTSGTSMMGSQDNLSLSGLSVRSGTQRSRRPVSVLFVQENGTISRANFKPGDRRRSVMELSSTKAASNSDKEFAFIETKGNNKPLWGDDIVQSRTNRPVLKSDTSEISPVRAGTSDRSDWLKADMTLRSQMVDPSDSLLLVRQEKILSFVDRMREDPKSLTSQLLEDAEETLKGLKTLQQELRSFLADVSVSGPSDRNVLPPPALTSSLKLTRIKTKSAEHLYPPSPDVRSLQRTVSVDSATIDKSSVAGGSKSRANATQLRTASTSELPPLAATTSAGASTNSGTDNKASTTMQRNASLRRQPTTSNKPAPVVERHDPIRKEGFLFKKAKLFDQWKKRYFVLRNGQLFYYESMTSEKLMGQLPIAGTNVQVMERFKRHDFVFSITVQGKVRYLCAQSAEQMKEWADAINEESMRVLS